MTVITFSYYINYNDGKVGFARVVFPDDGMPHGKLGFHLISAQCLDGLHPKVYFRSWF